MEDFVMQVPFYAKSSTNEGYIKNMEVVGFHDLNGVYGFQMALYKTSENNYYMYVGSFKGSGVNIIDVTDPVNPKSVRYFELCDPQIYRKQSTPKLQIADNIMLVALGGGIPFLHGTKWDDKALGGLNIYSLENPENPKLLSHWDTGVEDGMGVHRFSYQGGRYVYLTSECSGYVGFILRILDIKDPIHPIEAGRWWMPEQFADGMENGSFPVGHDAEKDWAMLHGPCYLEGGKGYMAYFTAGGIIVDLSDPVRPKKLGQIKMQPPFAGKYDGARCHTFLPLAGRDFAVLTNEGERFPFFTKEKLNEGKNRGAQPMNNLHMIDVSDPSDPTLIAEFPYPEVPEHFPDKNFNTCGLDGAQGPFGPHNVHEPMGKTWLDNDPNRVYCCYFHAGMRVYDVSDPYYIKEIAYFIPPNPENLYFDVPIPGPMLATTEDCVVDDRGYIYMDTFHDGMYILRLK
jgi:hypothetical protein